jgi:hypothetical protein
MSCGSAAKLFVHCKMTGRNPIVAAPSGEPKDRSSEK